MEYEITDDGGTERDRSADKEGSPHLISGETFTDRSVDGEQGALDGEADEDSIPKSDNPSANSQSFNAVRNQGSVKPKDYPAGDRADRQALVMPEEKGSPRRR